MGGKISSFQVVSARCFLGILSHVADWFGWICHAYCLMDNHYHLMIETSQANLSGGMRQLNGLHTQRFNRAHSRSGMCFRAGLTVGTGFWCGLVKQNQRPGQHFAREGIGNQPWKKLNEPTVLGNDAFRSRL